jgi:hypothetical protein
MELKIEKIEPCQERDVLSRDPPAQFWNKILKVLTLIGMSYESKKNGHL